MEGTETLSTIADQTFHMLQFLILCQLTLLSW